jgi:hypothetical protein
VPTVPVLETPSVQQEALPGRAIPRIDDNVSAASFGGGVAQGGEAVGAAGSEQQAKLKQQNDHTRVIDANTQLEAARDAMLFGPGGKGGGAYSLKGMDAINMPDRYLPQYDKVAAGISGSLTPDQQRLFGDHVAGGRAALNTELNRYEYGQSNQLADTIYTNATKQAISSAALNWRDPDKVGKSRQDLQALVQLQGDREGWDPTIRQQTLKEQMGQLHQNVVEEMSAEGNTAAARTYLFGASAQGEIEPKAADSMLRMLNAQEEHKLAMDDKMQRDASNGLLKNAILMQTKGQLTAQWIEQHHQTWEPQAYEYAYGLLAGKEDKTDPHVYAPLLQDALGGKDVTERARDALYSHQLSLADYKGVVEKSDAPRKGYVTRGADYIGEALKPNPLTYDPAASRMHANALDDWRQWTEDHPDASENEARSTYRSITDHYQIISADKATAFMPVPLHLVGSRMQPDIPQTWAATKTAHDSGQLSDAEYQRQALLIQQWMSTAAKKTPPKAPTP